MEFETDLTDQQKDRIEKSSIGLPDTLEVFLKAETKSYQNDNGIF